MSGVPEDDRLEDHVTTADLAAVVADWCEAHGVGRVDLAIALLGAEVPKGPTPAPLITGSDYASDPKLLGLYAIATVDVSSGYQKSPQRTETQCRAAALAVAAMRCDLEGR